MRRAIVIGSGFGGLAAAVRLRCLGYDVRVLEALDRPGGRARVFHRDGFTFDAGPSIITAPHLLSELFTRAARDIRDFVELVPVDPFYRILFHDGGTFDYVGDEERLLAQIAAIEPRDVDGYRRFARHAERIFDIAYTRLADQPFDRVTDMLRVAPDIVRLQGWRTVHGLVARYIRDERLRRVFSFEPLLVGGNPYSTSAIYALIHWLERKWGVYHARGGTGSIISALVRLLAELGVEVCYSAVVDQIVTRDGRAVGVHTVDGSHYACDIVVSNADPSFVYAHLVPRAARQRHSDRRLRGIRQSMSLFVGYCGARRTWPGLAHHTILLGARYEGLLDDIFHRRIVPEDFSLYVHVPTRTDASLAPPGAEALYILSPVPNNRSGIDWPLVQEAYFDRLLAHVDQRLMPGLHATATTRFALTPYEFERDLRSVDGAAFGPEPVLTQSAWFRYHNRSEDVAGLYFVGAGTHPGGGIPGVLNSAKVLERVVTRAG